MPRMSLQNGGGRCEFVAIKGENAPCGAAAVQVRLFNSICAINILIEVTEESSFQTPRPCWFHPFDQPRRPRSSVACPPLFPFFSLLALLSSYLCLLFI